MQEKSTIADFCVPLLESLFLSPDSIPMPSLLWKGLSCIIGRCEAKSGYHRLLLVPRGIKVALLYYSRTWGTRLLVADKET